MWTITELLQNFFTHKDFLPSGDQIPGTLFTPMHILFAVILSVVTAGLVFLVSRQKEKTIRRVFVVMWIFVVVLEITKILWETCCGTSVKFEWTGTLPLYPCSIFMYVFPLAIWGKGNVRHAACGYICSLGLLGGLVNFIYPANVLNNYSCLSFAGMQTLLYHGNLVFCACVMLASGYHRYTGITKGYQLLLPSIPFLVVSVFANLVNFSPVNSDYMFFKLDSFFFAPIGAALPKWACVMIVYAAYLFIHALPYLPSYFANRHKAKSTR